jgi:hypothetical protein
MAWSMLAMDSEWIPLGLWLLNRGVPGGRPQPAPGTMSRWCFGSMPPSLEYIRAGKLRGLAVTTAARSEIMLELPTIAEAVPG